MQGNIKLITYTLPIYLEGLVLIHQYLTYMQDAAQHIYDDMRLIYMSTCKLSKSTCNIIMSTYNLFMLTCKLIMSTCNFIDRHTIMCVQMINGSLNTQVGFCVFCSLREMVISW